MEPRYMAYLIMISLFCNIDYLLYVFILYFNNILNVVFMISSARHIYGNFIGTFKGVIHNLLILISRLKNTIKIIPQQSSKKTVYVTFKYFVLGKNTSEQDTCTNKWNNNGLYICNNYFLNFQERVLRDEIWIHTWTSLIVIYEECYWSQLFYVLPR